MNTRMDTVERIEYLNSNHIDEIGEKPVKYPPILKLIRFSFNTLGYLFPKQAGKLAYRLFSTPRVRAKHRTSDDLLESARIFDFMYGKQMLKGYEWGYGGRTILLVHGWESRGTALRYFVPQLLDQGFRVVAFDGPAHGNSDGKRTNLLHFAGAVKAILKQIGGAYGIITHSFGGASTVFALDRLMPDTEIEKLVLIGVPDKMENVLQDAINTLKIPSTAARSFMRYVEQKVKFSVESVSLSQTDLKNVNEVLIVHDEKDAVVPITEARSVLSAWANAKLLISKDYGHYRLMKNPDLISKIVRFMTDK
jgi:pimeloyl-ACP methyl ester carboxylesterase